MKKLIILCVAAIVLCLFTVNAKAVFIYDIDKDPGFVLYGNLWQNSPAMQAALGTPLAAMYCGPVAVTNSFRYLERMYPNVYGLNGLTGGNLVGTAVALGNLMGTNVVNGTWADNLIWGKRQYIENRLPGRTIYEAQYWPTWGWTVPGVAQPAWVRSVVPTWNWLWDQLVACEDVEILLTYKSEGGGHFVTVKSFHWNDLNEDGFIDATEGATIDFVDPLTGAVAVASINDEGINAGLPCMQVNYLQGFQQVPVNAWITMAVKESIPEPATIILLCLGGMMLRRKKA